MLKSIDPFTDHRWDDFVNTHPEGLIFHHSAWARVLTEKYGDVYKYYIIEGDNGVILGVAPFFHLNGPLIGNTFICLPSTDTCFPLANNKNDYEVFLTEILQETCKNKNVSMQINGCSKFGVPQGILISSGHYRRLVEVVNINRDLDAIRTSMTRNGRYNLRLAQKHPFSIKLGQDEKTLDFFIK